MSSPFNRGARNIWDPPTTSEMDSSIDTVLQPRGANRRREDRHAQAAGLGARGEPPAFFQTPDLHTADWEPLEPEWEEDDVPEHHAEAAALGARGELPAFFQTPGFQMTFFEPLEPEGEETDDGPTFAGMTLTFTLLEEALPDAEEPAEFTLPENLVPDADEQWDEIWTDEALAPRNPNRRTGYPLLSDRVTSRLLEQMPTADILFNSVDRDDYITDEHLIRHAALHPTSQASVDEILDNQRFVQRGVPEQEAVDRITPIHHLLGGPFF